MQLTGELSKVSLPNLLQLVRNGALTGKFSLLQGAKTATVLIEDGSIVHAEADALLGKEALLELFLWLSGSFSFIEIDSVAPEEHSINPEDPEESTDKLIREGQHYAEQKRFLDQLRISGQSVLSPVKDARAPKLPDSARILLASFDANQPLSAILARLSLTRRQQIQSLATLLSENLCVVVEPQEQESMEQTSLPDWVVARLRQDNPDISQAIVDMVVWTDRVKCWMFQADADFERIKTLLEKNPKTRFDEDSFERERSAQAALSDDLDNAIFGQLNETKVPPPANEKPSGRSQGRRPIKD
ncbi:MAG: DUF4388 domain-containing protein [Candidatus Melainabacteria bacterium]|jgi:hypothetical protein|nr:DUF4388 domain-containing protein [Candidatus Melainabacteria bacterium]